MQNEKIMHTLDDFAAFLDEAEHPAASFPAILKMNAHKPESMITLCDLLIDSEKEPLFYIARGDAHQSVGAYDAALADYERFLSDGSPTFPRSLLRWHIFKKDFATYL